MFYLRLNKLRIYSNGSLLGMTEVQLMSFVTLGEADFPMLNEFFRTSDAAQKRELVSQAVARVVSSRVMPQIQRVKDHQIIYFGDTGYNVFVSDTIPESINWMLMAIKSNQELVDNATLLSQILTGKNISTLVSTIGMLSSASSPVTSAVSTLTTLVAESILKLCANSKDRQLGLLLTSFTRQEHYPFGKRDSQNVPDATGNMKVDYTIFGF
ncbi:hypothetical protein Palpr_0879 [Paludibacter propionicigenes WB4]|uniref:Uncharacterized protein n=1 Tax=Paludibacter propionicigenes (strain DSM 17365 / JCM 13257 / WB4) TaxID=694427 RepID=E4T2T6_PALPW|nr:hypothetical protein [Paludibacter propionicigenes]ADQ79030.1 hypothetical protein Palpr_0879 [Paludibacter propionicigenes WB4]